MPVLTDDEVGLGVLTDADVGLGKTEPLGPLEPPQYEPETVAPVVRPPRVEAPSPMGGMPLVFIPPVALTPEQATARRIAAPSTLLPSAPERFGPDVGLITPLLREVMPQVQEQEPWQTAALKAAAGVAVSPVEFATSPLGALTLAGGPIVPRVTSAAFAADMIGNAVKSVGDLYDNWQRMTPARKAEALVNIGGNVIMGGFLGKKAITGWGKQPLGLANVTQRQRVQAATELAESNPQLFGDLARDEVRRQVAVEERAKPPVVTPLPVVPEKREEPAPVPPAPEPTIRDITAPTTEAVAAMRAGVAERLEAGKAAPGTAAAEASARAQAAVETGAARVEAAPAPPAEKALTAPAASETVKGVTTEAAEALIDRLARTRTEAILAGKEVPERVSGQKEPVLVKTTDLMVELRRAGIPFPEDFVAFKNWVKPIADKVLPKWQRVLREGKMPEQPAAPAAQAKETYAPEERKVEEGVQPERVGTDAQRLPDEAGPRDSVQPAAEVAPEAPRPPEAPVLLTPEAKELQAAEKAYANANIESEKALQAAKRLISDETVSSWRERYPADIYSSDDVRQRLLVQGVVADNPEFLSRLVGDTEAARLRQLHQEGEQASRAAYRRIFEAKKALRDAEARTAPPAAEAAKPAAAKEPWQMTKAEWQAASKAASDAELKALRSLAGSPRQKEFEWGTAERLRLQYGVEAAPIRPRGVPVVTHERVVQKALSEGKPVPPEVLADYPDLKPAAPSTKAAKPDYVVAATEAAQAAFERLGSAERGASDLSKRKGMTKAQLARLAEYDKAVEAERQAKARARQEQQPTPGAAAGGPELPSVGAASAAPGGIPPRAAIEQLADAFAAKAPTAERLAAFVRNAFNFGARGAKAKDALSAAVQGMKTSGTALWDALTKFQTPDDLLKAKGDLSAELETRGWRVRQFVRNVQASVPDKARRAAIAKWIDAGGDDAVLAAGEAATKPEYKQAYRDARNLTADEKIQAQNIQNYFDTRLQEAIDAGVLEHGLDDYIHRIYEKDPSLVKRALAYVQSGILSRNPALAKKRLFEFDWQAEQQGFRPVQDFLPRIAAYEASLSRAIAARKFVQRMSELTAPDGRPIVGIKGVGIPLEDPTTGAREGTVIKPLGDFKKNRDESDALNYRGDYEDREFPALSKWKWVSTDAGGKPIFVQGDVAIHPDYVKRVDALLKPSSVRKYAPLRTAQAISATVKQTMLDMSFFHQVQIAVHGLEHRVNPFRLVQTIDFEDPNVQGLLKGGVTLGGEYYPSNLGEGLVGRSLTQHIPMFGQILETYHGWLFQDFIPRMKLTMGLHALERNRQRYARDLASGRMSEDALYLLTAKQANAAFGELNYTMLERNKTVQDMARLVLLAPDFLEARGRFVAQALTKYGTEQRVALLLGAITMWTAARVMNKIADDQWHLEPENLFNLVWRNNAYGLRTVQGDVLHMLTKPIQFWTNRLNPVYGRTMMELLTQRDQFGRKRDMWEQLKDAISTVQPIATRSSRERHLWESILNSFGVTARRWNDVKNAHELASKWKKENNIREQPGEFIYDSDKDPLRPLKIALSEQDDPGAVKELKRVLDRKVMTPEQVDKYFNRYAAAPFTGSRANDVRFMASLSADDKKTVQAAQQHRRAMLELYRKTRRQLQAATQPRPAMPAGIPLPAPVPLPPMFQP